jgi:hypothetical protein
LGLLHGTSGKTIQKLITFPAALQKVLAVAECRKGSRYGTELGMVAVVETSRSDRIASEMLTSAMLTSGVLASAFPAEQEVCLPPSNSE